MKKGELRINSLYTSTKFQQPVRCELSDLAQLDFLCQGAELDSDVISEVFEPLELTEDWLAKTNLLEGVPVHNDYFSGFIKVEYNNFIGLYELYIGFEYILLMEYVHQLQNIYFALTGEELTL